LSVAVPGAVPISGPGRGQRLARRVAWYLPTIVVFLGGIALWEVGVGVLGDAVRVLPRPSAIVTALVENWGAGRWPIARAAAATLFEAFGGLLIGTVAGVIAAFAITRWRTAREIALPLAIGASAVPIIAFAPLMNNWFGVLNPLSKMAIAAVLVFFPIVVSVIRGLTEVEPAAVELVRSYAAGEWAVLRRLRIPNALPYFFTALKLSATLSLIGAIVGEYFGGSSEVIGRVVVQSASAFRFDVTWAAIIVGAATGIALYLAIVVVERLVIPWHASLRGPELG
jgi:NitT/TauT family transport system permease protein